MITPMDPHWYFYPRPPRGGRRKLVASRSQVAKISTHALREEGDFRPPMTWQYRQNFYPRPPRGGRLPATCIFLTIPVFLPTPSARRATEYGRR